MRDQLVAAEPEELKSAALPAILVVDDDPTSLKFVSLMLKRSYRVTTATSLADARKCLVQHGFDAFECVLSDYQMPGGSGLDLLTWVKSEDPCLASVILTGEGERSIIADSLRTGVCDFLEKPVQPAGLERAIAKAVDLTRRQRQMQGVETAVHALGGAQNRMLATLGTSRNFRVTVCFHPKLEAGGDFFSYFKLGPNRGVWLLTDVSGHELQSAYLSAYLQGMVRGMLHGGASVVGILDYFNGFLTEEWNRAPGLGASVAICALEADLDQGVLSVVTAGTPACVFVHADGRAHTLGTGGGFPLGWFPDPAYQVETEPIDKGDGFMVWTDGLEDLAEHFGVTSLTMAYRLRCDQDQGRSSQVLDQAGDDVLLAAIESPSAENWRDRFQPLIVVRYGGDEAARIDEIQETWRRNLEFAVPGMPEPPLWDLLLACREALLNALNHGCDGCADRHANFQVSHCPGTRTVRVWVEDPGPGHDFDFAAHADIATEQMEAAHRGLILIHCLAKSVTTERNGATLIMDFDA